jgi:nitroreductase
MNILGRMLVLSLAIIMVILQSNNLQADCVSQLLKSRYSGYDYDSSKLVSRDMLKTVLEAGRLAPSSYNEQPWHFLVCNRATDPVAYQKALNTLVEDNRTWAKNAPVLVLCVADTKSAHDDQGNGWAQYDTGAAAFAMMAQATSLGLMTHQMGGFDSDKARKAFSIPDQFEPMAVMAIGYATAVQNSPEKKRKPLQENFFEGAWGHGFR